MTDHTVEVWFDRRVPPASILALLLLAGASSWLGWYAYRGELSRILSATPAIEIDLRPPAPAPPQTTPSVVLDLAPTRPAAPPASKAAAPVASQTASATTADTLSPPTPLAADATSEATTAALASPGPTVSPPHAISPSLSSPIEQTATIAPPAQPAAPLPAAPAPLVSTAPLPAPSPQPAAPAAPSTPAEATGVAPSTTESETSSADLLTALGTAPSPVTQKMIIANAAPPAAPSATAGETRTASAIYTFLPPPGDEALPVWQRYARPFDTKDPRPRIAIVITKLGLLHGTSLAAIDQLPADVTLSFSPYADDVSQWIAHARSLGHEVMLDLPMESSQSGADPGSEALLTTLSAEENLQRLAWVVARANGYVGLAGFLGDRFTASPAQLRPVLGDIARRGLMFLGPHASADSVASAEATQLHLPRAIADLTIDDTPDRVSIDMQLAELEHRARVTGFAVGIANGYPVTIERLADWSRSLAERNLALAPVTAIVDEQADR